MQIGAGAFMCHAQAGQPKAQRDRPRRRRGDHNVTHYSARPSQSVRQAAIPDARQHTICPSRQHVSKPRRHGIPRECGLKPWMPLANRVELGSVHRAWQRWGARWAWRDFFNRSTVSADRRRSHGARLAGKGRNGHAPILFMAPDTALLARFRRHIGRSCGRWRTSRSRPRSGWPCAPRRRRQRTTRSASDPPRDRI